MRCAPTPPIASRKWKCHKNAHIFLLLNYTIKSRPARVNRRKDHIVSPPPFRRRHRLRHRHRAAGLASPALAHLDLQPAVDASPHVAPARRVQVALERIELAAAVVERVDEHRAARRAKVAPQVSPERLAGAREAVPQVGKVLDDDVERPSKPPRPSKPLLCSEALGSAAVGLDDTGRIRLDHAQPPQHVLGAAARRSGGAVVRREHERKEELLRRRRGVRVALDAGDVQRPIDWLGLVGVAGEALGFEREGRQLW